MNNLIIRLDDAAEHMNYKNWKRMEELLDKYNIKPIVGVIPDSKDQDFIKYDKIDNFWDLVLSWERKDWHIAMHGYQHLLDSKNSGINPVNNYSEFAGLSLEKQKEMIKKGYCIFISNGIEPKIFFAPAHTFDDNTIKAIKKETRINIISDTIANDIYYDNDNDIYYIPQQSGKCRFLPFKIVTYCYHPNIMCEDDFVFLESFFKKYNEKFEFPIMKKRRKSIYDNFLKRIYFLIRRIRNKKNKERG